MYQRSTYFKAHFTAMTFEKRKAELLEKAQTAQITIDIE
jgi:hypothetical protein